MVALNRRADPGCVPGQASHRRRNEEEPGPMCIVPDAHCHGGGQRTGRLDARPAVVSLHASTRTLLIFVNSRMPKYEHSRPYPESLTPPNGMRGSERTFALTKLIPASS